MSANELRFWLGSILICMVSGFFFVIDAAEAEARYRPIVATQDEGAITCGSSAERDDAFAKARQIPRLRVVRVNAIENMNPLFGCDPVAAVRAIAAAGYKPYVTVVGSPAYAKFLAQAVGPLVDAWGVWNEVNLPSWGRLGYMQNSKGPSSYRKLIARMGRVLRRYDPGAKVRIGELAPLTGKPTEKATGLVGETRYMDRVLKRGATLRVDGLAVHAYAWYGPKRVRGRGEMTGYILMWRRVVRRWARDGRLCRATARQRAGQTMKNPHPCRPVPIYVTEAGYMRASGVDRHKVFDTPTTASRLVASWRQACQQKVRQMFHYQLVDNGQPEWDTALFSEWGARPEFGALQGYLRTAKGCKGRAGALGPEYGPPVVPVMPRRPLAALVSPLPLLPPDVPVDTPVLVEPPDPLRVEPEPVIGLPGPPEPTPAVEPPAVEPTPEPEPPVDVPPVEPPVEVPPTEGETP